MGHIAVPGGRISIPDGPAELVAAVLARLIRSDRGLPFLLEFTEAGNRHTLLVTADSGLDVVRPDLGTVDVPADRIDFLVFQVESLGVLTLDVAMLSDDEWIHLNVGSPLDGIG